MTACFSLAEVLGATRGQCIKIGKAVRFVGVSTDTRTITPGALFVALSGERFDGHEFVIEASQKGAAGIIAGREMILPEHQATLIQVENPRLALQELARFHRCRFQIPLIAVTGSNGKTSTKDMIAAVLSTQLRILKTEANYNNEIGLSQTLLQLDSSHEAAVVEMGMRGTGEIAELAAIALPTVGVVTNVGETHLERLGSIENIAGAKAELIEALTENGVAVLNSDDVWVKAMRGKTAARIVSFGRQNGADVQAKRFEQDRRGVTFECVTGEGVFPIFVPVPGVHSVYNALAAIATGRLLGLGMESIAKGLAEYQPGKMRLNIRQYAGITVIDDTYNASPLSMAAAIDVLAELAKGRKIAVIGDMLELGPAAQAAHERVGGQLAEIGAAVVITVGEMARFAAEAAERQGGVLGIPCQDHEQAINELKTRLMSGDTVLFKGSRGMRMEKLLAVFATSSEG